MDLTHFEKVFLTEAQALAESLEEPFRAALETKIESYPKGYDSSREAMEDIATLATIAQCLSHC
jgi:hypothetical protein